MIRRNGLAAYAALIYSFLYLPLAVMFVFSFDQAPRNLVWTGWTARWYLHLFHDAALWKSFLTSLSVALTASFLSSLIGIAAAYALAIRPRFRGKRIYSSLINLPLIMPEIVMGAGLLIFFVRARVPLNFWTLSSAHAMIALPYSVSLIRARFLSLRNSQIEEAAQDLGASPWQAFFRVTLALAKPAILGGALLAFTISFEDFTTSFFISGIGITTLPVKIYSMIKFGVTPEINALSSLLLGLTILALIVERTFLRARD
jgi:spermidine/putrescine transport system permease protein